MLFRFLVAIVLVVLVSLAGVALEKGTLDLRRRVSRQHFREEVLRETHARLRLRVQEFGTPSRMIDELEKRHLVLPKVEEVETTQPAAPLLFWDTSPSAAHTDRLRSGRAR